MTVVDQRMVVAVLDAVRRLLEVLDTGALAKLPPAVDELRVAYQALTAVPAGVP